MPSTKGSFVERRLAGLYDSGYRKGLSRLGHLIGKTLPQKHRDQKPHSAFEKPADSISVSVDLKAIDDQATHVGNLYRGYGLLAAILFTGVLWSELFPHDKMAFLARLVLIAGLLGIYIYVNKVSGLRERWKHLRQEAGEARYEDLGRKLAISDPAELESTSRKVLEEQIAYNDKCHHQYEGIEMAAKALVTTAVISLFAYTAFEYAHFVPHWVEIAWKGFFRFLSAPAIGLLVFNAFINLWKLVDDHEATAHTLRKFSAELDAIPRDENRLGDLKQLAGRIRETLDERDRHWGRQVDGMIVPIGA